jgi:mRNA interferase MazF
MTNSDPAPKRWDVVVVPFPYSDRVAEKRRPALVVSADALNAETGLLWVVMITSSENKGWHGDVDIPADVSSGLKTASTIRTAKLATIERTRVLRVAGEIDEATALKVRELLVKVVG